jgi:bifunctional DNA-binding transcriptional regulator/antitoxin component of YhaV-PrlF toxin-antitoxin module
MSMALNVNARGTVTIPRELRKALGVLRGGLVSAGIVNGKVTLEPAMLTSYRVYSNEEVARLQKEDTMSEADTARLKAAVRKAKAKRPSRG